MGGIIQLWIVAVIVLTPLLYFLFYAYDIFGFSKWFSLLYVVGLVTGFLFWKPMVIITLALGWVMLIGSWVYIFWHIFRGK